MTVRIAVLGAGLMGSQHASTLAAMDAAGLVDFVGVAALDQGQAEALASRHNVRCFDGVPVVLASADEVDAVVIATPTDTHADLACAAFERGLHAFVEKPIARSIGDARRIVGAAKATGRVLQVGHVIRYFDDYRRIHDLVTSGAIGTPAVATFGRRCQQPDWAPDRWHVTGRRSGGVAVDMMIHDVDLVRWMFGEPSKVMARTLGPDRWGGLDYALATLEIDGGPICHLHASWAEPSGFSQMAEVCGSGGMISYDSRRPGEVDVAVHAAAADAAVTALPAPPPGPGDPFWRQMSDFAQAAAGGPAPPADGEWALRSLAIALAMVDSSDAREPAETTMLGVGI